MQASTVPGELLVPPRRLGQLLAKARVDHGFTLDEASAALGSRWSSVDLLEIETGIRPVMDRDLASIADLYDIGTTTLVPTRSHLVVDLSEGILEVGTARTKFDGTHVHRRDVLSNYLAMVYAMRDVKPGYAVPLRLPDLHVLSGALEVPTRDVEDELRSMMVTEVSSLKKRRSRLRGRVLLPLIGIVVGVTTGGTILLVSNDSGASEAPNQGVDKISSVPAPTEIGDAMVQERSADGAPLEQRVRD